MIAVISVLSFFVGFLACLSFLLISSSREEVDTSDGAANQMATHTGPTHDLSQASTMLDAMWSH